MRHFLSIIAVLVFFLGQNLTASLTHQEKYGEKLNSRFVMNTDIKMDVVAGIPLRASWWSRPHEYAWASQFADEELIVLDAACGVSHPFKWYLGQTCLETWACDADPRISSMDAIIQETYDDLGGVAYAILKNQPNLYKQVKLMKASICAMPSNLPQYDRIFCISTLEHLCDKDRRDALREFSRLLAPKGLLVLTVDYPEVTPEALITLADSFDLIPAGEVSTARTSKDILTEDSLYDSLSIYRCVLKHR